jgi:hypothetical protein
VVRVDPAAAAANQDLADVCNTTDLRIRKNRGLLLQPLCLCEGKFRKIILP